MSDPGSVANVEQSWLAWFDQQQQQITSYLSSWQVLRAQNPEEIRGIVITLDQYLRTLNGAVPAANTLSRQGAPSFMQRLNTEIQLRQGTLALYYKRHSIAVTALMNAANARAMMNQSHQRYIDVMSGSCFDCHLPGLVAGGGYCLRHARMRGLIL
jgi:hypothetical protein